MDTCLQLNTTKRCILGARRQLRVVLDGLELTVAATTDKIIIRACMTTHMQTTLARETLFAALGALKPVLEVTQVQDSIECDEERKS